MFKQEEKNLDLFISTSSFGTEEAAQTVIDSS